jgi:hypothetical protein
VTDHEHTAGCQCIWASARGNGNKLCYWHTLVLETC